MKVPWLYADDDGQSHWGEVEIAFEGEGTITSSVLQAGTGISFVRVQGQQDIGWHTAPRRQFVITLAGEVEYESGDGSKRLFRPGDIFLVEDVIGRGHAARCRDLVQAFVPLSD